MTPPDDRTPQPPDREELDEVDPTGIRDLLRSLPDPGPMPEELVRRIETRLAVELAHRDPVPYGTGPTDPHGGRVVDLGAERDRRRPGRRVLVLGVAAAGLLVTSVAVSDLLGSGVVGGADTAAYAPASDSAGEGDSGAEGGAAGGAADEQAEEEAQGRGNAGGGDDSASDGAGGGASEAAGGGSVGAEVLIFPHLGAFDADLLLERVGAVMAAPNAMADSANLTAAQAKSCWLSVPDADLWTERYAAPATVEAEPAVVLWARQDDGAAHAWVLPGECVVDAEVLPLADAALPR